MAESTQPKGTPVTAGELHQAAHVPNLDAQYRDLLILMALSQLLTQVKELQDQVADFECHGGKCVYD